MLRNQRGMTLIEIMIVIAIIGGLMAILGGKVMSNLSKAKVKQTYLAMGELSKALDMYYTDCGQYPTTEQGLKALLEPPGSGCSNWGPEPYIKKNLLKDPFNYPFIYEDQGNGQPPLIKSLGADGKEGGEGKNKDLTSQDDSKD
jgi:general secretion pathway protein G